MSKNISLLVDRYTALKRLWKNTLLTLNLKCCHMHVPVCFNHCVWLIIHTRKQFLNNLRLTMVSVSYSGQYTDINHAPESQRPLLLDVIFLSFFPVRHQFDWIGFHFYFPQSSLCDTNIIFSGPGFNPLFLLASANCLEVMLYFIEKSHPIDSKPRPALSFSWYYMQYYYLARPQA